MRKLKLTLLAMLVGIGFSTTFAQDIPVDLSIEFAGIDCGQTEACYQFFIESANTVELIDRVNVRIIYDDAIFDAMSNGADVTIASRQTNYLAGFTQFLEAPTGPTVFGFDGSAIFWDGVWQVDNPANAIALSSTPILMFEMCFPLDPGVDPSVSNVCTPVLWDIDNSGTSMDPSQSFDGISEGANVRLIGAAAALESATHFAWTANGTPGGSPPPYGAPEVVGSGNCISDCNLPVELIEFDAELTNAGDGLLTWRTASEEENSHFDVERSFDGFSFVKVGEVAGAGTTSLEQSYGFTDPGIDEMGVTDVYYRLKQNDFDGSFDYSEIEVVNIDGAARLDVISVRFGGEYKLRETFGTGIKKVDIYSMNGQLIMTNDYDGLDVVDLNVDGLGKGVYILRINDKYTKRLVVVR